MQVILASLLSFFVPQDCGDGSPEKPCVTHHVTHHVTHITHVTHHITPSTFALSCHVTSRSYGTPCEPNDNINFSDPSFTMFNKLVVIVNFLLVACFAVLYYVENQRETWLSTCIPPPTHTHTFTPPPPPIITTTLHRLRLTPPQLPRRRAH
jgi:hypothetical protein